MQSILHGARASPETVTLAQRIETTGGRSSGFDYLRIILALSVILWHSFGLSYGKPYVDHARLSVFGPAVTAIVPMFFALSGFLVAGSLERSKTIVTFLGLRVIRIFPALVVEVALSALIIGPIFTTVSLAKYFTDHEFYVYFLNMLGNIHFELPGLFLGNPFPGIVNGQLWTVPRELQCYIAITIVAILTISKRPWAFLGAIIVGTAVIFARLASAPQTSVGIEVGYPGPLLVLAFLAAVWFYIVRDRIYYSFPIFLACAVGFVVLCFVHDGFFFTPFPVAYATIYLGLTNPGRLFFLRGADYSYGVYLYGFVIQQVIAGFGPLTHHWYINFLLSVSLAAVFAAFSWHVIEKPALRLKKHLFRVESLIKGIDLGKYLATR